VNACRKLACQSALIDGEIVVEDENGVSDFDALQPAIRYEPHRLVLFAFDLVHLDGVDLRRRPLIERREKLASLIGPGCFAIRYSEHFEGDAKAFFTAAVKHGLEGIVSKRATSSYRSGPSRTWLKTKNMTESDFVLLGLERDTQGRAFAHVGRETGQGLRYAGTAFMTFSERVSRELAKRADRLATTACPVGGFQRQRATWLKSELRVKVRHLRNGNGLRHASLRSICE
jgi:ATP-dependent DNA ligase